MPITLMQERYIPLERKQDKIMNRINPFENYFDPDKINQAGNVNPTEKIDGQNQPKEAEGAKGISGIQKSNEDDFVDTSNMIDDSGDFNMNDFDGEDRSGEIQNTGESSESNNQAGQEGANQNSEKDLEKASEIINDFLNQKKN